MSGSQVWVSSGSYLQPLGRVVFDLCVLGLLLPSSPLQLIGIPAESLRYIAIWHSIVLLCNNSSLLWIFLCHLVNTCMSFSWLCPWEWSFGAVGCPHVHVHWVTPSSIPKWEQKGVACSHQQCVRVPAILYLYSTSHWYRLPFKFLTTRWEEWYLTGVLWCTFLIINEHFPISDEHLSCFNYEMPLHLFCPWIVFPSWVVCSLFSGCWSFVNFRGCRYLLSVCVLSFYCLFGVFWYMDIYLVESVTTVSL